MADVAREARVNRITVSRALSHPELVAEDTLERIRAAIARTGYVPNQIARGLKAEHSRIVSLITPPQMSGVYGAVLERLSAALYESGLIVNLFPVLDIEAQREAVLPELIGWKPAAIVIFGIALVRPASVELAGAQAPAAPMGLGRFIAPSHTNIAILFGLAALTHLGVSRLTFPGRLQTPPVDWPHDGLPLFGPLARFVVSDSPPT